MKYIVYHYMNRMVSGYLRKEFENIDKLKGYLSNHIGDLKNIEVFTEPLKITVETQIDISAESET